jgi:hypothetical protein
MHLYNIFTEIKTSTEIQNLYRNTKPLPRYKTSTEIQNLYREIVKRGVLTSCLRATKSVRPCHHEVPESIEQPSWPGLSPFPARTKGILVISVDRWSHRSCRRKSNCLLPSEMALSPVGCRVDAAGWLAQRRAGLLVRGRGRREEGEEREEEGGSLSEGESI